MQQYIIKRLLMMIPTMIVISLMVFSLIRLIPGDAVMSMIAEASFVKQEDIDRIRKDLGLDRPFLVQYASWSVAAVQGDLGKSLWTNKPITEELKRRFPVTMELTILAIITALIIALPIGVMSAVRQDTFIDYFGRFFAILGLSLPDFWIATVSLLVMTLWLKISPQLSYTPIWENPVLNLQQFLLPSVIVGYRLSATSMRMTRSTMLEVLREDYIRTAWAKGLRERVVVMRHALKNALIPVVTIIGTQLGRLMGGTVIMEVIFALPGIGRMTFDAILQRDYPVVQANVMILSFVMLVSSLLVDLSYGWMDPRIRYS
ncbi:MAG: ABC transporter permease [Chloroflexi bacterium]|nr:ABC transporter permease [Chloroflexota bacterium]